MALTNAGRNAIAASLIGQGTDFTNTNAYLGVGDSTTAFDASQTDLQSASNKIRKPMDATYPTVANNVITAQSTYGPTEANWSWNEWGIFNASAAGTMLSRKVENNGTKLNGQTWVLQVQLTVNIGA